MCDDVRTLDFTPNSALRLSCLAPFSVPGKTKPAGHRRRLSKSNADSQGGCRYVTLVRIVTAFQGWTIIIAFGVAGLVGGVCSAPQAGLARIFLIDHLVFVFDCRQSRFDPVKLRRRHYVLGLGGKNFPNLVLGFLDPVGSLRMSIEGLRQGSRVFLLHRL